MKHCLKIQGNTISIFAYPLLEICGYQVKHKQASFPLEIFLLMGDIYVGNSELGKIVHKKRVKLEQLLKKHGKQEKLIQFGQALAELDLGRQAVVFSCPS